MLDEAQCSIQHSIFLLILQLTLVWEPFLDFMLLMFLLIFRVLKHVQSRLKSSDCCPKSITSITWVNVTFRLHCSLDFFSWSLSFPLSLTSLLCISYFNVFNTEVLLSSHQTYEFSFLQRGRCHTTPASRVENLFWSYLCFLCCQ